MRFVAVKSERQQAAGLVFRTRDLLVRQRTQLINDATGRDHAKAVADALRFGFSAGSWRIVSELQKQTQASS